MVTYVFSFGMLTALLSCLLKSSELTVVSKEM